MATTSKLENLLLKSVRKANKEYEKMTGGYWLWHAPESYVQMILARDITKELNVCVYPECTPNSIERDAVKAVNRGRPPLINKQQRFDLVVWWKNQTRPRALIELKLTYASMTGVLDDGKKLLAYRSEAKKLEGLKQGYLVVFNSAYRDGNTMRQRQGRETIQSRFDDTTRNLGNDFKLVAQYISQETLFGEKHHAFGVAVWKISF
jgi:hypothetical protein